MARILIIDDEPENLKSLSRSLLDENPDWRVLTAAGENQAQAILEEAASAGCPIDVVLTDLVMETEGSGMNVLQKARKVDPLIMSILFTAKEKNLDRYAAFDYGAFDVVEKNIRGASAAREINIKTRAALKYREWALRISFLKRYFDPKVFDVIERDRSLLDLSSRLVTVVFWDIRGFSRLCESLKSHPTLISGFLADYNAIAAKSIFANNGVLDKFIGDGVMALFGALQATDSESEVHTLEAVKAAIDFRSGFVRILEKWTEEWKLYVAERIEVGLGCGIHTGEALVGNVGTEFRDQFTALGAAVNMASRIESKSSEGQILISQPAYQRVRAVVNADVVMEVDDVKNIPGKFPLFEFHSLK